MRNTKKIALSGVLIAIGVVLGSFSIPVGIAKCAPAQHLINIVSAVLLGPFYAVLNAFVISVIRNMLGVGSLLAFPGSIFGAFLAGIFYKKAKNIFHAGAGELIGTAIIGGIVAYPVAAYLLGKDVAVFTFVIPFFVSSLGGTILAMLILKSPGFAKMLKMEENKIQS